MKKNFSNNKSTWHIYILRCADKTLYTGITTDVARRVAEHNRGKAGAKYTRVRRPMTLVYQESVKNRSQALKREWTIKKLSRKEKENLTRTPGYVTIEPC